MLPPAVRDTVNVASVVPLCPSVTVTSETDSAGSVAVVAWMFTGAEVTVLVPSDTRSVAE